MCIRDRYVYRVDWDFINDGVCRGSSMPTMKIWRRSCLQSWVASSVFFWCKKVVKKSGLVWDFVSFVGLVRGWALVVWRWCLSCCRLLKISEMHFWNRWEYALKTGLWSHRVVSYYHRIEIGTRNHLLLSLSVDDFSCQLVDCAFHLLKREWNREHVGSWDSNKLCLLTEVALLSHVCLDRFEMFFIVCSGD